MYENLPATGPAAIVIGGVAFFAWQLALVLLIIGVVFVLGVRFMARHER